MKILVIQLARYGDIFLTWPTLRALKSRFPEAEVHLAVRSRFATAAEPCEAVDRIWPMNTAQILEPLITQQGDIDQALLQLSEWLENLSEQQFDRVINLSFSPLSSYLTSLLSVGNVQASGYTRHSDGYFAIPDDTSAYFYAQVGTDKHNRYHLSDVFAAVAGVDLESSFWSIPDRWQVEVPQFTVSSPYVVIHPSASQKSKTLPAYKWQRIVRQILQQWQGHVVIIGSADEAAIGAEIAIGQDPQRFHNWIGRTTFAETAAIIRRAQILIGGDSAPMHIASFTQTPCLNLSFQGVNFWETGPRAKGSRIIFAEHPDTLPSDRVVDEVTAMLESKESAWPVIVRANDGLVGYEVRGTSQGDFQWQLMQAIYSGGEWPVVQSQIQVAALWQIREAARVAYAQMASISDPHRQGAAAQLMDQSEQAIHTLGKMVPEWQPLVGWFETEKLRMGPASIEQLQNKTQAIYDQLLGILDMYLAPLDQMKEASP